MTTTPAAKAKTTATKTTVEKNAGEAVFRAGTDYDHTAVIEQAKVK